MKKLLALGAIVSSCLFGTVAQAEDVHTLRLSSYLVTTHWIVAEAVTEWAKNVETASNGRIKINILPTSLGRPQEQFDVARDGSADIVLGVAPYTPGRFLLTDVAGMPGTGNYSECRGVASWRIVNKFPEMKKEFDGVVLLGTEVTTPFNFWSTAKEIKSVDDFKGLKVHTPGGAAASVVESLGMVPIVQPPTAAYQVLSTGVVDAVVLTSDGVAAFKLERVIKQGLLVPGGLTGAMAYLAMNPAQFQALGPELQGILMKESGEKLARIVGSIWDKKDAIGVDILKKAGGNVKTADAQLLAGIKQRGQSVIDAWIKIARDKSNADGQAIWDTYQNELKSCDAEVEKRAK